MARKYLIAGLALALAACGSVGTTTTAEQQIAGGCLTLATAVRTITLADQFGKVTEDQRAAVRTARGIADPICRAPQAPTVDALKLQAFLQAIAILQAHAADLERAP